MLDWKERFNGLIEKLQGSIIRTLKKTAILEAESQEEIEFYDWFFKAFDMYDLVDSNLVLVILEQKYEEWEIMQKEKDLPLTND